MDVITISTQASAMAVRIHPVDCYTHLVEFGGCTHLGRYDAAGLRLLVGDREVQAHEHGEGCGRRCA